MTCVAHKEMPVKDGLQTIREWRQEESSKHSGNRLPFCAITGNALQEQASQALAAGMDKYLAKPYTFDDVKAWINSVA